MDIKKSTYDKINGLNWKVLLLLLLVFYFFWTKIIALFKPKGYEAEIQGRLNVVNNLFHSRGWISKRGNFMTENGRGIETKYNVQQAQADALRLANCMGTGRKDSWYESVFSVTFSPSSMRIKALLNPGYPATYRRYVINAYESVYTPARDLEIDAMDSLTTVSGIDEWLGLGGWNKNLQKYFIL